MIFEILKIASQNPLGFTFNIETKELVTTGGWVIAYQETQDSFGKDGLESCLEHAKKHQKLIGGWLNEENQQYYFDSVMLIKDREEAIRQGLKHKQIGIYHLETGEYLPI
ncbi:hypothetical protein V6R21_20065 [Limibacter armeniacum]|uniref:hypothetical protein n=1 Tax=Limibacter armeniacum TaxID=466084 RepID=UPI002FE5DE30